jgi:hypothetical protein
MAQGRPQPRHVNNLRAMFNDARRVEAGQLIDTNPFAGLGLRRSTGRKHVQPPAPGEVARLIAATRHYFAWYLLNMLELPDHVVAAQLRHSDGGTLVRELYGHRTAREPRNETRPGR